MMNEEPLNTFYKWLEKTLDAQLLKLKKYCSHKHYIWDEDLLQQTIWLVADNIIKKGGLQDMSEQGLDNFFFVSFINNLSRKYSYSYNKKRDDNISDDNGLFSVHEEYLNNQQQVEEKIKNDMREDFCTIRILEEVENQYGNEISHIFAQKYLMGNTYSEVIRKNPNVKDLKKRLLEAKQYIKEKFSREKLNKEFEQFLDEISLS